MVVAGKPTSGGRISISFIIETTALTKRYRPDVMAVNGLSMKVRRGEVYGFVGPNGAGKTTTLRMLVDA